MDRPRTTQAKRSSRFANTAPVGPEDRVLLETRTGREAPTIGREPDARQEEIREKGVGSRPVGDRTGIRQPGSGANETDDGLDATEEMVRHAAEDRPEGEETGRRRVSPAVFDRREG